tara:strand:- start:75 stop:578 length:504 start_codon:yes stop_codon:yes gene_type:complete
MAEDSKNWWSDFSVQMKSMLTWFETPLAVFIIYFLLETGGEGLRSVELAVLLIILAILVIRVIAEEFKEKKTVDVEWITDKQVFTFFKYFIGIPIVLFTILYVYDYVEYDTAHGLQMLGICASLLTIVIVLFALDRNKSMIEAAAHAWLMLTVLGAIVAIIVYLVIF